MAWVAWGLRGGTGSPRVHMQGLCQPLVVPIGQPTAGPGGPKTASHKGGTVPPCTLRANTLPATCLTIKALDASLKLPPTEKLVACGAGPYVNNTVQS